MTIDSIVFFSNESALIKNYPAFSSVLNTYLFWNEKECWKVKTIENLPAMRFVFLCSGLCAGKRIIKTKYWEKSSCIDCDCMSHQNRDVCASSAVIARVAPFGWLNRRENCIMRFSFCSQSQCTTSKMEELINDTFLWKLENLIFSKSLLIGLAAKAIYPIKGEVI